MRVGTNRAGLPSMCAASPLAPSRALAAAMVAIEGTFWCRKTPKKHKDGAVPPSARPKQWPSGREFGTFVNLTESRFRAQRPRHERTRSRSRTRLRHTTPRARP